MEPPAECRFRRTEFHFFPHVEKIRPGRHSHRLKGAKSARFLLLERNSFSPGGCGKPAWENAIFPRAAAIASDNP
jgi:hypothetical protein